jgi:hypothetical protein
LDYKTLIIIKENEYEINKENILSEISEPLIDIIKRLKNRLNQNLNKNEEKEYKKKIVNKIKNLTYKNKQDFESKVN